VAEALKPWYRALCKRPCFHDEYLDSFNRPNVTLVDTDGAGVERLTESAIVANGVAYEVDCIVFASGFHTAMPHPRRIGYEAYGLNGVSLLEKWKRSGMLTLYGTQVPGFPNLFLIGGISQVGVDSNQTHVLDVQSQHVAAIVRLARERDSLTVDVTEEAAEAWGRKVYHDSRANFDFLISCTPGYYNNEGQPDVERMRRNGASSPGISFFTDIIEEWRDKGMPDLLLNGVPAVVDGAGVS
jgi:cyclohexanone monooxygenase